MSVRSERMGIGRPSLSSAAEISKACSVEAIMIHKELSAKKRPGQILQVNVTVSG